MSREGRLLKRRKKLRHRIKSMRRVNLNERGRKKLARLEAKYEELGSAWYKEFSKSTTFGLDITDIPVSMDEVREAMKDYKDSPSQYLSAEYQWRYNASPETAGALVHLGDVSHTVEFRVVDGKMQMYRDGVEEGILFSGESLRNPHPESDNGTSN